MKCRTILRLIGLLVACGFVASAARAQSDDWARVKDLPAGAVIYVTSDHGHKCIFQAASDEVLVCAAGSRELILKKKNVREVRMRRGNDAGEAVGGLTAAAAAAPLAPITFGMAPVLAAVAGGSAGGAVGGNIPLSSRKLIYKRK